MTSRGRGWCPLLLAALSLLATSVGAAPLPPPSGAALCWRQIHQFDALVIDRFDYRVLAIEDYELAEARRWRDQAEDDCSAQRYDFGRQAIEAALEQIGVPPGPGLFPWFRD